MTPDASLLNQRDAVDAGSLRLRSSPIAVNRRTVRQPRPRRRRARSAPRASSSRPFVHEYLGEDGAAPEAELFASVVSEVVDPEFTESLEDLVNDAAAVAEQVPSYEGEDPGRERRDAERAVREFLQPLQRASYEMFERLDAGLQGKDVQALSESEFESLFEQLASPPAGAADMPPAFEHFIGGLLNKAKAGFRRPRRSCRTT